MRKLLAGLFFVITCSPLMAQSFTANNVDTNSPCADFTVPNIFTPNNDGVNDVFFIKTSTKSDYSISIYNRDGIMLFQSASPNISWDGRTVAGQQASDGIYYYIIKSSCGGNEYDKKGYLQLIR